MNDVLPIGTKKCDGAKYQNNIFITSQLGIECFDKFLMFLVHISFGAELEDVSFDVGGGHCVRHIPDGVFGVVLHN